MTQIPEACLWSGSLRSTLRQDLPLDIPALRQQLDGELLKARIPAIRNHLKVCWKCRSMLAQLEPQVEMIARLLTTQLDSDIDRSTRAKEKFLEWRTSFEKQRKSFFRTQFSLLGDIVGIALAQ
jgi:predicted anti-sigma-YlaC factor YlaD